MVFVAQLSKFTKYHSIVCLKWFIVCQEKKERECFPNAPSKPLLGIHWPKLWLGEWHVLTGLGLGSGKGKPIPGAGAVVSSSEALGM